MGHRAQRRNEMLRHRWRADSLWVVPLACVAAGALLALITLTIDAAIGYDRLSHAVFGTPTAVQTVLSTAASSMLTLTTVVLTVMTLGVQLAMQQFSPRIVRALLADRRSQAAHGLFAATFLYCMVTVVKVDDQAATGGQVPSVTVAVAYSLLLASLVSLVAYVHHAGQSLRVAGLIDLVGDNLQVEIERLFPVEHAPEPDPSTITAPDAGVVVVIDHAGLVELARREGGRLEMCVAIGDFVPRGAPVLRSVGSAPLDHRAVRRWVLLDNERSHIGDAAYGLRKLVDIAERSVASSPFDDPTTAVQAIDRLHDSLRQLVARTIPDGLHHDRDGVLRLVTRELTWPGYVALVFTELIEVGSSSPLVVRRLLAALDDLLDIAPAGRRAALEEQRDRLLGRVQDATVAIVPDIQGLGSGRDLSTRADGSGRDVRGMVVSRGVT